MPTQSRRFNLIPIWPCVSILFIDVTRYLKKHQQERKNFWLMAWSGGQSPWPERLVGWLTCAVGCSCSCPNRQGSREGPDGEKVWASPRVVSPQGPTSKSVKATLQRVHTLPKQCHHLGTKSSKAQDFGDIPPSHHDSFPDHEEPRISPLFVPLPPIPAGLPSYSPVLLAPCLTVCSTTA